MPWSHLLPAYMSQYPLYETEIRRAARFIHAKDGKLAMIDVGANIGDTIAELVDLPDSRFLCIEASRRYFELLAQNYRDSSHVIGSFALLDEGTDRATAGERNLSVSEVGGTAHIVEASGEDSNTAPRMTLDQLTASQESFSCANFLKVDTDGFDLHVLKGGRKLLANAQPVLHVEVSPQHWQDYGKTGVADYLRFLADLGYEQMLVYDNLGYLVGEDRVGDSRLLFPLSEYALRKRGYYFNTIVLPRGGAFAPFVAAEFAFADTQRTRT